MTLFSQLSGNLCLTAPVTSWFLAQVTKFVLTAIKTGERNTERLWGSGGMPSSHAATVCALTTIVGIIHGVGDVEFALAAIFALVVMYDACGVRLETGRQGKWLNDFVELLLSGDIFAEVDPENAPDQHFREQIGHTLPQVVVGALLGVLIAVVFAAANGYL